LDQALQSLLNKRQADNTFRSLKTTKGLVDFFSNDYLGFAQSATLFEKIESTVSSLPHLNGATGSRLLSGNSVYAEQLEKKLANFFHADEALIFNSGYSANVGVLSAVPQRADTILYDELSHASIKDGARLSLADRFAFKHNDMDDLERKLKIAKGNIYVVVESVYSMDGDVCPLRELISLSKRYNASIILDEAHSTGIFGKHGNGFANELEVQDQIAIRIYTFGKAMGCHGACVTGSAVLKNFLVNFSRPFIYTTALPYHSLAAIDCTLDALCENENLQSGLFTKVNLFHSTLEQKKDVSPIQSVVIGNPAAAKSLEKNLIDEGFEVRAIVSPTVRQGTERLRICLHTFNKDEEVTNLARSIQKYLE
jgi:8-amino-7-oxononanoate synthase